MLRRLFASALAGGVALATTACDNTTPASATGNANAAANTANSNSRSTLPVAATPADVGAPLYEPKPAPPRPTVGLTNVPIVIRQCQLTLAETENVPSKNDGKLWFYCTEKQPGEVVDKKDLIVNPRTKAEYRRLREGDTVKKGQLIAIMDDMVSNANVQSAKAALIAAQAKKVAAEQLREVSLQEKNMYEKLRASGGATESEFRRAIAQFQKSIADVAESEGDIQKATEDLKKAEIIRGEHDLRADIDGVVKRFYRKPGEAVKALEPVMEIQNQDTLRVEGLMDVQYLNAVNRAKSLKVFIEPAIQDGHLQALEGHLQPVIAVAVSKDPRKPLIVTGSLDKTARVWDRATPGQKVSWYHGVPVRAVACTPPGAETNLALTGADDGIARLWELDELSPKPLRELKGRHGQPISCVAFAPDGKTCATADAREILLWDVATGDLKYRFPAHHRGPIEYIQFLPQAKLISAARDRTACLWALGEKGAAPEINVENRSGNVPVIGASADGSRVLLDSERSLRVIAVQDQRTEAVFLPPSDSGQFATFAMFSPDGRLVLAAGSGDSPLQLWKAPAPGVRGHLFRRLALGPNSQPTCAAFAPDSTFAVTGSADNKVLVWGMPTAAEIDRELTGTLTFRDQSIDPNDRRVRIWAELSNPEGVRLTPGDTVTMVIPQEGR